MTFTNYTGGAYNWNNWDIIILPKDQDFDVNNVDGTCYARYRADNWGDGPCFNSSYRGCNWNWDTFKTHVNGATVVLTIEREGSTVKYRSVVTKDATTYEQNYRSYNVGDATQDIDVILTVDLSYLTFADATAAAGTITDTDTEINHEIVGNRDNSSVGGMQLSKMYVLGANESLKLSFKNYSAKGQNYYNWIINVSNDFERYDGANFTHYMALRADNWDNIQNNNTDIFSNFNWDTFQSDMDGATVDLTVTRDGAKVTVRCDIAPSGGGSYYEEFAKECGDGTQNIRVFLTTEKGHLDILPESIEIGETGWGTYVSEYNLDFSQAEAGLTAYKVTGKTGSAINKEELTGIVPAGTPMLLSAETVSKTYTVPVATSAGTTISDNCLKAGAGEQVNSADGYVRYVMVNSSGTAKFKKIGTTGPTINTSRAYLEFTGSEAHELLSLDDDDVTGIKNIKVGSEDNVYYNLNGQRVLYPTKGLYIVNGKKVIIK